MSKSRMNSNVQREDVKTVAENKDFKKFVRVNPNNSKGTKREEKPRSRTYKKKSLNYFAGSHFLFS
ncbi:MAG: hypothetical protein WKG06_15625 [Segetibacter sp.]